MNGLVFEKVSWFGSQPRRAWPTRGTPAYGEITGSQRIDLIYICPLSTSRSRLRRRQALQRPVRRLHGRLGLCPPTVTYRHVPRRAASVLRRSSQGTCAQKSAASSLALQRRARRRRHRSPQIRRVTWRPLLRRASGRRRATWSPPHLMESPLADQVSPKRRPLPSPPALLRSFQMRARRYSRKRARVRAPR